MSGRRAWLAVLALGVVATVLYFTLPRRGVAQAAVFLSIQAMTAALVVVRAVRTRDPWRSTWRWLAVGQVVYLAATVSWYLLPVAFGRPLPFPSLVDGAYFTSYSLFAVFLLRLVRARASDEERTQARLALLDAGIFTVAVSAALWVAVIEPNVRAEAVTGAARAVALAYPMYVALLFGLATRLFVGRHGVSVPEALLMLWVAGELAGDAVYGYQSANGTFEYGSLLFAFWLASSVALGALAAHPRLGDLTTPKPSRQSGSRTRPVLLLGAAVLPLALAVPSLHQGQTGEVAGLLVAAGATFVLVLVRVTLIAGDLDEQRRLARELERVSGELRHRAYHDVLTSLGNRALLLDRLEHAVSQRADRPDAETALLLLDVDGFKNVNDTRGHEAGDELLRVVAQRLRDTLGQSDTVARLGGDEFAVVVADASVEHILRTTRRLLEALRVPAYIDGRGYSARASVGVCLAGKHDDATTMLRNADLAMYAAKGHGGDRYELFRGELHHAFVERHELELRLRDAPARGELRLHYQPIVDLATGAVSGAEALVRWEHPDRGLLYPDAFIDIAEDSGSVIALGRWVLEQACIQVQDWVVRQVVEPSFRIAVNVSRRQLLDPQIVDDIAEILHRTGTRGEQLEIEVTESALMTDTDLLIDTLQRLKGLGLSVAMDDFGTGYSSLEQLRRLPIDVLKIDRGFVNGIDHGSEEFALATAILKLATSLGKSTVAEGVETPGQAAHLRALKARFAQGYLFGRPLPAHAAEEALHARAAGQAAAR